MGAKEVTFSGGEPLLWPHIYGAVEEAVKHDLKVTIYTSGNVNDFKQQATHLHKFGSSKFIFSLFGAAAEIHERITRKSGSFENTKASICDVLSDGSVAEIHFVPMAGNYRELDGIAKLARHLGASRVSVLRLVSQGRAALVQDNCLNRVQNLALRRQIQDLRKAGFDIRTGSPYNFLMLSTAPKCCAAIDRLIIGPDLRLYPCDAFKRIDASELVKTGNWSCLADASLPECWEKSPYLEAVRAYLMTDFEFPCNSCRLLEKCLSGCLAQKVIAYNSLDKKPDPDCLRLNFQGELW